LQFAKGSSAIGVDVLAGELEVELVEELDIVVEWEVVEGDEIELGLMIRIQ